MDKFYIRDSIEVQIGETLNDTVNSKQIQLKDNVEMKDYDMSSRALEVTIDATHCGYFNRNNYFYSKNGMASSVGSFLEPYEKPILVEHDSDRKAIGRIKESYFIPIPEGRLKMSSSANATKGLPTGKIRIKALITDSESIKDILASRFLTVSIGGRPLQVPRCSICGDNASMGFMGIQLSCEHEIGDVDEKKGYVGIVVDDMDYSECSFVNHPADYSSEHAAKAVEMALVSYDPTSDTGVNYDQLQVQESLIFDSVKKSEEEKKMTVKKETLDKAQELEITIAEGATEEDVLALIAEKEAANQPQPKTFDEMFADAMALLETSEGCDNDISVFWTDAKEEEIAQVAELDQLFVDYYNMTMAADDSEDSVLAPAGSEKRQEMSESVFCGPNRTFPVSDCELGSAVLAILDFPKVGVKYGDEVRAKIKACVMRKGTTMKYEYAIPKSEDSVDAENLKKLEEEKATLTQTSDALTTEVATLKDAIKVSDTKIIELVQEVKDYMVEKIIDFSMLNRKQTVADLLVSATSEEFDANYAAKKEALIKRTVDSLKDSISDMKQEFHVIRISDKVNPPKPDTKDSKVIDPIQRAVDAKKQAKSDKTATEKLFGTDVKK